MSRRLWIGTILSLVMVFTLASQHLRAQIQPADGSFIRLKLMTFDPRSGEPQVPAALRAPVVTNGTGTYLVQFDGPVTEAWKMAAAQAGAKLYGYIPDHTFIARLDSAALARVRALPFVRWAGPYHPAYRLDAGFAAIPDAGSIRITAQTLPDADLDALAAQIAGWGGTVEGRSANPIAGYVRATLPSARLATLAAQQDVVWVAPYMEPELLNDTGGGQIMHANEVRQSLGLFGAGQTVAVADTGLDLGSLTDIHTDFQGRVIKGYCLGRPSPCDWGDRDAHGTHVAGSVLGSGQASGSNPAAHQYPAGSFAGTAPEARLVMQSIEDINGALTGIPDDTGDLMRQTYPDGARIHTNSWGGPTGGTGNFPEFGGYIVTSQQVDQAAWEQKDLLILFAAGNSGADDDSDGVVDPDSIGQPGTAKNVITVGASENSRPGANGGCTWGGCFGGYGSPISGDDVSDDANGLAAFSSRGPTDDGRIKPDLVAPGTNIVSARSRHPIAKDGWGVYDDDYIYQGGTSMATPLTAGAAAVVREWLTRVKGMTNPSAALMRTVLINGAADMSPGQYGNGASQEVPTRRPNNVTGWGRVDLRESLDPPAPRGIWLLDNQVGIGTGQTATYQVTVSAQQAQAHAARRQTGLSDLRGATGSNGVSPQGTSQLVQNGGFESGLTSWDTFGDTVISTSTAHSGAQSVQLGGSNGTYDRVFQDLNIPAGATDMTIDFWYGTSTFETLAGFDGFCYGLWDADLLSPYLEDCGDFAVMGNRPWSSISYSLSAAELAEVAGKSVVLVFEVWTDSTDPSAAWVDDVALSVTAPDGPTATPVTPTSTGPTPTTNPTPGTGAPLRVTLAWTDFPGQPAAAKALVNDLDLEVIGPDGTHYTGNQGLYTSGQCLRDSKWDACNNTEGILLPQAGAGTYTIVVHGAQVPQGQAGQQPFALTASGNGLTTATGPQHKLYLPLLLRRGAVVSQAPLGTPTPTPVATPAVVMGLGKQTRALPVTR